MRGYTVKSVLNLSYIGLFMLVALVMLVIVGARSIRADYQRNQATVEALTMQGANSLNQLMVGSNIQTKQIENTLVTGLELGLPNQQKTLTLIQKTLEGSPEIEAIRILFQPNVYGTFDTVKAKKEGLGDTIFFTGGWHRSEIGMLPIENLCSNGKEYKNLSMIRNF